MNEEATKAEETKRAVIVTIGRNVDGKELGWYAAGRFWAPGTHEAELTAAQLETLIHRGGVAVLDADTHELLTPAAPAAGPRTISMQLTVAEAKKLAELRAAAGEEKPKAKPLASLPTSTAAADDSRGSAGDLSSPATSVPSGSTLKPPTKDAKK